MLDQVAHMKRTWTHLVLMTTFCHLLSLAVGLPLPTLQTQPALAENDDSGKPEITTEATKVETDQANLAKSATRGAGNTAVSGSWKTFSRPDDAALKEKLTNEEYRVIRDCGTEPPFHNEYWNLHEPGLYVDRVSGEPLFSSRDKYDSGSGWPSFTKPIEPSAVTEKRDDSLGMSRTEIRSSIGDSHLGHVFDDGPGPNGLRYCMNSTSLRFVPLSEMKAQGYAAYIDKVAPEKGD